MLKELFEAHFYYKAFKKRANCLLFIKEESLSKEFSLIDRQACIGCRFICDENPENRSQLIVFSNHTVNLVNVNQIFSYIDEEVGDICDFLLDDSSSASLIELTCTSNNYIESKRQKARIQLYNTIRLFYSIPDVKAHFLKEKSRYVIFSWKETFVESASSDEIERSMLGMTKMANEVYSPENESDFDFDFKLREIKYPDVLNWDSLVS